MANDSFDATDCFSFEECPECLGLGTPEGCKKCGSYDTATIYPNPQKIKGVSYRFVTNTDKNDESHKKYKMKKIQGVRIKFRKAFDIFHRPTRKTILAVWVAVEDLKKFNDK